MPAIGYIVFLGCGLYQFWYLWTALSHWMPGFAAALVAFFSAYLPIPWFIPTYWYVEGQAPLGYILAFVVAWSALAAGRLVDGAFR